MVTLQQGMNLPVNKNSLEITISFSPSNINGHDVDCSAFLLGETGKVRSDDDFIFYNQDLSKDGSVQLITENSGQKFIIDTTKIAADIKKVSFAITIHGAGSFSQASSLALTITDLATYVPEIASMQEAALILGELYLHTSGWKFRAVGQGFTGGLAPLATHFGVDVSDAPETPVPSEPIVPEATLHKINLEKRIVDLEKKDQKLLSLVKKVGISLEKKGLTDHQAKVALCLDISASMRQLYGSGAIDTLVERVLALGFRFDDDGAIDTFLFGMNAHHFGAIDCSNYINCSAAILKKHPLEPGTYYGKVMAQVREFYKGSTVPVYIMFVTDGATGDKKRTETELRGASHEPLFWQFMAINPTGKKGAEFDFLEKLDDMSGRFMDNADFFQVQNPATISDDELYGLMTSEYPNWLIEARSKGMIS